MYSIFTPLTYKPWSAEDTKKLLVMWSNGVRVKDIADELQRTKVSVMRKRDMLSLPSRHNRK